VKNELHIKIFICYLLFMILFNEAIKLKGGILHNLSYHQDRINHTLFDYYKKHLDISYLKNEIPECAQDGFYKFRIIYSDKIESVELIPYSFRKLKKVGVVTDNSIDYSYKYADKSRLRNLLDSSRCDDILIIKNGLVTDAYSSNLVFASSQGYFTPENCLLSGTKRNYLLDQGKIKEKAISLENIKDYDCVYFINAMVDLEDNIKFDVDSLLFIS